MVNWEPLIARQRQLNDTLVASGLFDEYIATITYPPAPESEIVAAEERLGVHLDPTTGNCYRSPTGGATSTGGEASRPTSTPARSPTMKARPESHSVCMRWNPAFRHW